MMDKPTRILTTALLVLLIAGTAMGEIDVTLETYDKNGDGIIDADERIMLDIDIMSARIRISESMFAGGYTTTGSLILNDELQDFAFADRQIERHTTVTDLTPVDEPKVEVIDEPIPDSVPDPTAKSEDDAGPVMEDVPPAKSSRLPILVGVGIVLLVATATYLYYWNRRDTEDK